MMGDSSDWEHTSMSINLGSLLGPLSGMDPEQLEQMMNSTFMPALQGMMNSHGVGLPTPLHIACSSGDLDSVKKHLENIDIDEAAGLDEGTPLHYSTYKGNTEVFKYLVDQGANLVVRNKYGDTVLCSACKGGHSDIAKFLLQNTPCCEVNAVNNEGDSALIISAGEGRLDIVQMLLRAKADVSIQNKKGISALYVACRNNHLPVVKLLLAHNADINIATLKGATPLMAAAQNNHEKIVQVLTHEEADCKLVTKQGTPALAFAIQNKHHKVAEFLLDVANAPPDYPTCESLLVLAVKTHQESTVKSLLEAGADPNRTSKKEGLTALLHAVDLPIVKLLLEHGADPGATDGDGGNALHIAAARVEGDSGIFLALQAGGVDPCALDNLGRTPLDVANAHGNDTAAMVLDCLQPSEIHMNNNNKKTSTHTSSRIYSSDSIARGLRKEENRKKQSNNNTQKIGASMSYAENEQKVASTADVSSARVSNKGSTHTSSTRETGPIKSEREPGGSNNAGGFTRSAAPIKSETVPEKVPERVPDEENSAYMKEDTHSADVVGSNHADILDNIDIHMGDLSASMGTKLPEERPCAHCGTLTRKKCARCKTDYFCARECQKAAYAGHKARCLELYERKEQSKRERAARKATTA